MTKNNGDQTKYKVLSAAEKLFARNGFHATSVAEIAEAAEVNKALVYYYFKNKDDVVSSLFRNIIEELDEHIREPENPDKDLNPAERSKMMVEQELTFLAGRQPIIAVMLMEALKGANADNSLLQCAEAVIQHDVDGPDPKEIREGEEDLVRQKFLADEFFMGFIPLIGFVVFRDKWCEYFKCDSDKALEYFLEAFTRSHLAFQSMWDNNLPSSGK